LDVGTFVLFASLFEVTFAFVLVPAALAFVVALVVVLALDVFLGDVTFFTVVEAADFFLIEAGSAFFLVTTTVGVDFVLVGLVVLAVVVVFGFFTVVGLKTVVEVDLVLGLVLVVAALVEAVVDLVVVDFFTTGLFSFEVVEVLVLGASLTLPEMPLGREKTPFSVPLLIVRLIWETTPASTSILYLVSRNFLIVGRETPVRASSG